MFILSFACFIAALTIHEYAHALTAFFLGDETAYRNGRLTLNPLAHIDPIGTLLIPLIGSMSGLPVFGWAKPVPYNPYNLKYGRWGGVAVAAAGPGTNFAFAAVCLLLVRFLPGPAGFSIDNLLVIFLATLASINVYLGAFNLLPVPPLDGSRFLQVALDSPKHRHILVWLETKGAMLLLGILLLDYILPGAPLSSFFSSIIHGFFGMFGF